MTDELVYRLRGQRTNGRICEQAADEIERLQKALHHACYIIALELVGTNEKTVEELTEYWIEECMEKARRG